MRRILRTAGGVTTAAAVLLLIAPIPASAGGPTSVILVSPGRQATASLYASDEAYGRLTQLVGENPTTAADAPDLTGGPGSDAINVSWLIHDVQIWRVDRIFTSAKGGPWIETTMVDDGKSIFEAKAVRHKAADGPGLVSMLSALRLLGSSSQPGAFQGAQAPVAGQPQTVNQPVQTVAAAQETANLNWLWLIIGAAAGITLVVGFRPLVRRVRPN